MALLIRMESGRFKVFKHLEDFWSEFRIYHRREGKIFKENGDPALRRPIRDHGLALLKQRERDSRTLFAVIGLRLSNNHGLCPRRRKAPLVSRHGVGLARQSRSLPRFCQNRAWLRTFDRWDDLDQPLRATVWVMPARRSSDIRKRRPVRFATEISF
jgi:hypothetical protein